MQCTDGVKLHSACAGHRCLSNVSKLLESLALNAASRAEADLVESQCLHVNVVSFTLRARVRDDDSDRLLARVRVASPVAPANMC